MQIVVSIDGAPDGMFPISATTEALYQMIDYLEPRDVDDEALVKHLPIDKFFTADGHRFHLRIEKAG